MVDVPLYVLLHVGKGSKFVPAAKRVTAKSLAAGLQQLRRSLLVSKTFLHREAAIPSTRCRIKSDWQPPGDYKVDAFIRLLREELLTFTPKQSFGNMSWLDRLARGWLKKHAEVLIIDCDKGLGDALVLSSWVQDQVRLQLSQGYVQTHPEEFLRKMSDCKLQADTMVQFFRSSGCVSHRESQFLLSKLNCNTAGVFRILAKIHKQPVASRPVCNLRHVWFTPFLTFLVEHLGPLTRTLHSVFTSTDQLIEQFTALTCAEGMQWVTLDVVNLYPSVSRQHLFAKLGPFLRQKVHNYSLCTFILRILELILDASVVTWKGEFFESQDGIPTGLSVASILANLYLWHFDCFLEERCGAQLQLLRRYIDDLLLLWAGVPDALLDYANSWHDSLCFDLGGSGTVNFLDVTLSILPDRRVHWSLYRKPRNLYLYVPANSCHPVSSFKSLQVGGFLRCIRRNRLASDVERSLSFFKQQLKARGYCIKEFDDLIARFRLREQACSLYSKTKVKQAFLKMPFTQELNIRWLNAKLRKFKALLQAALPGFRLGICWTVNANLFRRRYKATWTC